MKTYIHVYLQQVLILVLPFVPTKKKKIQLAKYSIKIFHVNNGNLYVRKVKNKMRKRLTINFRIFSQNI